MMDLGTLKSKMTPYANILQGGTSLLGIDLRTLALFRVMLALTCMIEVITLWPDSFAFLDDRGLFPRSTALTWQSIYYWSVYYISGHIVYVKFLFLITLGANMALLLGYYTRIATLISWILILSLSSRLVIFTSGAHMLLPILLFWALFLPLGARFSIDAALTTTPAISNRYRSVATVALLIQIACVYLFSALLKTDPMWWRTGEAIYYALNTPAMNSPWGAYLSQWPTVTRYLTLFVFYLELFAVVFLFSPVKTAQCRLFIVPLLVLLHVGFLLFLSIGFFPLVCITGVMVFVPSLFWDTFLPWFNSRAVRQPITIYYDKACGFCYKTCLIFKALGLPSSTQILPAQDFPEIYSLMQETNSWVVAAQGKKRLQWDAVAWCWRRSPLLWPLGILFLPAFMKPVGQFFYKTIACHREILGKWSACALPFSAKNPAFTLHGWTQVIVAILLGLVLTWNIGTLSYVDKSFWQNKVSTAIVSTLGIEQLMQFFAPFPYRVNRWVVIEGFLDKDYQRVDILHNHFNIPSHARPANGYQTYKNHYWQKYFSRINATHWQKIIGRYYCQKWYNDHGDAFKLHGFRLTLYEQLTPPPGEMPPPARQVGAFSYFCSPA